jgi:hypothetical protein
MDVRFLQLGGVQTPYILFISGSIMHKVLMHIIFQRNEGIDCFEGYEDCSLEFNKSVLYVKKSGELL